MRMHTRRDGTVRSLRGIARVLGVDIARVPDDAVTGIAADSRQVQPGDVYIATVGARVDGHAHVADAARRGAVAAVVEREPDASARLPLVRVANGRSALAKLAAWWHDEPAGAMRLVGITGTMGKTSTLAFLESILLEAGIGVGSVGSLGVRCGDEQLRDTGYTVPDPIQLHEALADLRGSRCDPVVMEATTHAITQQRLHGVAFTCGVFTGLVPLEHTEYHPRFREYAEAKLRFFEFLRPGAPLVYNADCPVVSAVVGDRDVIPVACGTTADAAVRLEVEHLGVSGSRIRLGAADGVPLLAGRRSAPFDLTLRLPLAGRSAAVNASLAAATAAVLGAAPESISTALGSLRPAPRRMDVSQTAPFLILDDFGGHPDTVSAVFEVVESLPWRRLHLLSGYRGSRGPVINRAMADALGTWLGQTGYASVCLTAAEETSDERNRAEPAEREAFEGALAERGVRFTTHGRLDGALDHLVPRIGDGDLLLILGTQGMDGAAAEVRGRWPAARRRSA
jgi:UDP-N-acetylmuramoyl-L-alanyl-D-glutamate--2,6-diaminopimelate ligase